MAPRTAACPSCGAGLRPDALWCSLCHQDLRPAPAPVEPDPAPAPVYAGHDPLTAPLLDMFLAPAPAPAPEATGVPAVPETAATAAAEPGAAVTWPCTLCGAQNALALDVCAACGSPFLAGATELPTIVLPGVGDLRKLSRVHRAGVAFAVLLAVLLPLALITFLLTGEPPKDGTGIETTVTTVAP